MFMVGWRRTGNGNSESWRCKRYTFPPHRDVAAVDGAPDRFLVVRGEQAAATTKATTGILRCAQNDSVGVMLGLWCFLGFRLLCVFGVVRLVLLCRCLAGGWWMAPGLLRLRRTAGPGRRLRLWWGGCRPRRDHWFGLEQMVTPFRHCCVTLVKP